MIQLEIDLSIQRLIPYRILSYPIDIILHKVHPYLKSKSNLKRCETRSRRHQALPIDLMDFVAQQQPILSQKALVKWA